MKFFYTLWLVIFSANVALAQKNIRPYTCGWVIKDSNKLKENYEVNLKYLNVKKGEHVASVGAQNGNIEVRLSLFIDSIQWTLQDIDSGCLNKIEFEKVLNYYETLSNKKINSDFELLLGSEPNTNLPQHNYDRILLINTYHELTKKSAIISQIYSALKPRGYLVIMEKMGKRKGKKRRDCNHIMPYEVDFLNDIQSEKFKLNSKKESAGVTFYEFEKLD
jgi:ubiquinone/menaquinone biosynthesis C-methylase UbiE